MTEEEQEALNESLLVAVQDNEPIEEIKALIEKGADVNAKNGVGYTVLMQAASVGTAKQIKLFIEKGADVNAKDIIGQTALMRADTPEKTKLLIEAGADVNFKDKWGRTALMYADTPEKTKLLIEAGADVNAINVDGYTALNGARTAEQKALIKAAMQKIEVKEHIEVRKRQILKSRKIRKVIEKKYSEERVSDLALVDEIAKDVISGKEKRTITPEVGAEIKRRKALEK